VIDYQLLNQLNFYIFSTIFNRFIMRNYFTFMLVLGVLSTQALGFNPIGNRDDSLWSGQGLQRAHLRINPTPTPAGTPSQYFCNGATIANLTATGTNIQWYAASSGGTALDPTTALTNGTTYYATQTISACESINRLAVTAINGTPIAQTVTATQSLFTITGATTVNLASTEIGVNYYLRNDANNTVVSGPVAGTGAGISLNTGTITATTTYNTFAKRTSKALDFNGSSVVSIGNIPALKPTNHLTLEAWVYVRDATTIQCIISGGVDAMGYNLVIQDGFFRFWGQGYAGVSSTAGACQAGNWYHIALTYQETVGSKMYINGVLNNSNTDYTTALVYDSNPVTIGILATSAAYVINGKIDEVRIWNTVRTLAEIQADKDNCLTGNETGLVLYYDFEEGTGTTLIDKAAIQHNVSMNTSLVWATGVDICATSCSSTMANLVTATINPVPAQSTFTGSGATTLNLAATQIGVNYYLRNNANNTIITGPIEGTGAGISFNTGTIATTTTYNAFAKKATKALDFNGTNHVLIGNIPTLKPTSALTLEAWVYVRNATAPQCIISGGDEGAAYNLVIQDGLFRFWGEGYAGVSSTAGACAVGNWYHLALTYQENVGSNLYINGVLNSSNTAYKTALVYDGNPVTIGMLATSVYRINGKIDEVRIWNTVRTLAEIQADKDNCLMGNETGLVLACDFEDGMGMTLTDKATIPHHGTLSSNMNPVTAWVTGVDGCDGGCSLAMANLETVTIQAPLPLELLRFTGKNTAEGNILTWETANEVNTKGFNIERSMEHGQWLILGFLPTKGAAAWYDFTDPNPFSVSYYRLRQIDNGGKETFSKIISLSNSTKASLKVYPNPATDVLTVPFADSMLETAPIFEVRNVLGQLMLSGTLQRSIDIATLPSGTYILRVGLEQVKFLKE
jgi:Concanavalin A-like lectin/glucanases superfamily/Secretion system C-terminal sorting domain/Ig-like domain CHU_C associated